MDVMLATQLLGVAVMLVVIVCLTGFVLLVRRKLVPVGEAPLTINGVASGELAVGSSLLEGLSGQGVILAAACGGRGNCGQCVVQVRTGGGTALPNESAHLSLREIAEGKRLACMVRVREALAIELPDNLRSSSIACRVASRRHITPYMMELNLEVADGTPDFSFKAGQYVLLEAPPYQLEFSGFDLDPGFRELWQQAGLLELKVTNPVVTRRAYSLANNPAESGMITLVIRIALPPPNVTDTVPPGIVSSYVFSLQPGHQVNIAGPFGEFQVKDTNREMVLIAGGAGIAPIRSIILEQLAAGFPRPVSFWYGVRNERELCYSAEFDHLEHQHPNFSWHAALSDRQTDSHWTGCRGLIHNVVRDEFLAAHPAPEELEYYLCGPPVMSSAVKQMLLDLGVDNRSIFFDDFGS